MPFPTLFAYFGPETLLPLTSIVATVVGVFLMLGRGSLRVAALVVRGLGRRLGLGRPGGPAATPHGRIRRGATSRRNGMSAAGTETEEAGPSTRSS